MESLASSGQREFTLVEVIRYAAYDVIRCGIVAYHLRREGTSPLWHLRAADGRYVVNDLSRQGLLDGLRLGYIS